MREINSCGLLLNLHSLQAALQGIEPGQVVILRGHPAQRNAYMMLCECLSTDFAKSSMPVAFSIDKGMRSDQLATYVFDGGVVVQTGIIRNLAVPTGFDPPDDSAG